MKDDEIKVDDSHCKTQEHKELLRKKAEEIRKRLAEKNLGLMPDWMVEQNFRDMQRIPIDNQP